VWKGANLWTLWTHPFRGVQCPEFDQCWHIQLVAYSTGLDSGIDLKWPNVLFLVHYDICCIRKKILDLFCVLRHKSRTMANPGIKNLKPLTTEKAREIGRKGGIRSGEKKRERKFLSEIYGEVLSELYEVDAKKGTPAKNIIKQILARTDNASVSMLKEIREATEGNKLEISGTQIIYLDKQDEAL